MVVYIPLITENGYSLLKISHKKQIFYTYYNIGHTGIYDSLGTGPYSLRTTGL